MKTPKRKRGDAGELVAARYLKRRFYRILEKNYVAGKSEIDLIASTPKTVLFVEVKTRVLDPGNETVLTKPASAVGYDKQQAILRGAREYLASHPNGKKTVRFDVIEVYLKENGKPGRVHHIKDAFRA